MGVELEALTRYQKSYPENGKRSMTEDKRRWWKKSRRFVFVASIHQYRLLKLGSGFLYADVKPLVRLSPGRQSALQSVCQKNSCSNACYMLWLFVPRPFGLSNQLQHCLQVCPSSYIMILTTKYILAPSEFKIRTYNYPLAPVVICLLFHPLTRNSTHIWQLGFNMGHFSPLFLLPASWAPWKWWVQRQEASQMPPRGTPKHQASEWQVLSPAKENWLWRNPKHTLILTILLAFRHRLFTAPTNISVPFLSHETVFLSAPWMEGMQCSRTGWTFT